MRGIKIVAYASSSRPNVLWSEDQHKSALPKNRQECDVPLVSMADFDAVVAAKDHQVAELRDIVERAQAIISTSTYPNWHEAARSALAALDPLSPSTPS